MPKGRSGAGVSSGSFLDLKAEVSKKVDEFEKSKARGNGKAEPIVGGVKRDDKASNSYLHLTVDHFLIPILRQKIPSWMKKNKGVASRAARDEVEFEAISQQTVESARAALERKSKIYDKLQKGLTGGLNDKQYDNLLVDVSLRRDSLPEADEGLMCISTLAKFDKKAEEGGCPSDSDDEEDVDESATVPGALEVSLLMLHLGRCILNRLIDRMILWSNIKTNLDGRGLHGEARSREIWFESRRLKKNVRKTSEYFFIRPLITGHANKIGLYPSPHLICA